MANQSRLSIIIPCYNGRQYLDELVSMLENQTVKCFDVILVDDGSSDESYERANELFTQSNLNYQIIQHENSGVSRTRNVGASHATGEYLYFLDCDDKITLDFVEQMIKAINEHPALDMIFFRYLTVGKTYELKSKSYLNHMNREITAKQMLLGVLNELFEYHMCAFIVRRNVVTSYNIKFDEQTKYGEDHEFMIKCLVASQTTLLLDQFLFNYCLREGSVTDKYPAKRLDSIKAALRVSEFLQDQFLTDHEVINSSKRYVAIKVVYNMRVFSGLAKEHQSKEVEQLLLETISEQKSYLKYFDYKSGSVKKCLMKHLICTSPSVYMKLKGLASNLKG